MENLVTYSIILKTSYQKKHRSFTTCNLHIFFFFYIRLKEKHKEISKGNAKQKNKENKRGQDSGFRPKCGNEHVSSENLGNASQCLPTSLDNAHENLPDF